MKFDVRKKRRTDQGDTCSAVASGPLRLNWKCRFHTLGTVMPSCCAGLNLHFRAESRALEVKYRLCTPDSSRAFATEPLASTFTRILTSIFPWMVRLADAETSGMTRSAIWAL